MSSTLFPPEEEGDFCRAAVTKLMKAFRENPAEIGKRLLLTLEVGKCEHIHQERDLPMVYSKTLDDLGLVVSVTVNPRYDQVVLIPKSEFSQQELDKVPTLLRTTSDETLGVMLLINQLERDLLTSLPKIMGAKDVKMTRPPIEKWFDNRGFPIRYQLNWNVETVHLPHRLM